MSMRGPTRTSWEPQLARAAGPAVAMFHHSFSLLTPGVVGGGGQDSAPDGLAWHALCRDSMVFGGTNRVDQLSARRVPADLAWISAAG